MSNEEDQLDTDKNFAYEVIASPLDEEMRRSYLDYAMSVIVGRALPDARDGMKPVHRRIMHSMNELGNSWNKAYKKSARVVGDTIGKYHPHGDAAVYETMVRMAQVFSLRYPLIDGQGNFGSVDGDSAAAMRYTEVRLSKIAHQLLEDLEKSTVDFGPNYDGSESEPLVLPSRLPNLLLNGSEGIAVGMATKIPPHHLGELIDACLLLLADAQCGIDDLIKLVPAPDFPTGGLICGLGGAAEAYRTGRGSVVIRSLTHFEESDSGRTSIVVDELPYQVNKKTLQEKIAKLVLDKQLDGISNIQDESDKSGMRLVIELKKGEIPEVVLNQLFRKTDMQISFGINMVALVEGRPVLLNLKEALEIFLSHRKEVIVRRTMHELAQARARGHILEGFAVALSNVDEIVELIKGSADPASAKAALMGKRWASATVSNMLSATAAGSTRPDGIDAAFGMAADGYLLTEAQALEILGLRLQRLTGMEQSKLVGDYGKILGDIADYEDILAKDERVAEICRQELEAVKSEFNDGRRSQIVHGAGGIDDEDLIPRKDLVVTVSKTGYVKTQEPADYAAQKRGGRGKSATDLKESDSTDLVFKAHSHSVILCFTSLGRALPVKGYALPEGGRGGRGRPLQNFLPLNNGETVVSFLPVSDFEQGGYLALVTGRGTIKRTPLADYKNIRASGLIAIDLAQGDRVVSAALSDGKCEYLIFCSNGKATRFEEEDLRSLSRQARGVRAMRFDEGERVVSFIASNSSENLICVVSERGYAKRLRASDFRKCNRGTQGVRALSGDERIGKIACALRVEENDDLLAITDSGIMIRVDSEQIRETGRSAMGVRIMKLGADQKIASVAAFQKEPVSEEPVDGALEGAAQDQDGQLQSFGGEPPGPGPAEEPGDGAAQ